MKRPRWFVRIVLPLAILAGLAISLTLVGLGAVYLHYRRTQDFATFVAERPVSAQTLEGCLPGGAPLARDEAWSLGEWSAAEGQTEVLGVAIEVTVTRGPQVLMQTTVTIEALVDEQDWSRRAYSIRPPVITTGDGMRAAVQVGLIDLDAFLGDGASAAGAVVVDAVVAAGEGEDSFRVVELDGWPAALEERDAQASLLRNLLGLVSPSAELPAEGLWHQGRGRASLSWRKRPGGSSDVGFQRCGIRTSCHEYSYETRVELRSLRDGAQTFSSSEAWSEHYEWGGELW